MLNWTQTSGKNQNNYGDVNDHIANQIKELPPGLFAMNT